MQTYIIKRLLLMVPTLILVTMIVFLTVRLLPGDVIDLMEAEMGGQVQGGLDRDAIERSLGLDVPVHIQYVRWVGGILRGDLGNSLVTNRPVMEEILHRLSISIELGFLALVISLIIALPVGIFSAIRQDTIGDYAARSFAIAAIAIPSFWLSTMVIIYPSIWWGWSPPLEVMPFRENPLGNLGMFIIPAVIMGMIMSGTTMRMTRTMMLEVLRQDYIRTAWAKGHKEPLVVMRHALKNALIPVVTIVGLNIPNLISGLIVVEQIFALPGLGRLIVEALSRRDYTTVSAINLIIAVGVMAINLGTDLIYAYLDPRVHYS